MDGRYARGAVVNNMNIYPFAVIYLRIGDER